MSRARPIFLSPSRLRLRSGFSVRRARYFAAFDLEMLVDKTPVFLTYTIIIGHFDPIAVNCDTAMRLITFIGRWTGLKGPGILDVSFRPNDFFDGKFPLVKF
jgi:hypothetical protein